MERKPGDRLDPYEMVSAIGKGGMGEVWKARDTGSGAAGTRHCRGARSRAQQRHHASRSEAGQCSGDAIRPQAARLGLVLVNGHTGVGSCETAATLTMGGAVMGIFAYMSPEQAQGKPVDARSDIFSFGLVLYELVSGRQAFTGNSGVGTMAAIIREEPALLDATSKLSEIVTRCLRKSPAARFQTMSEVRTALDQAAATPVSSTPSIAVLPFANMSGDKEREYFSDGLAEEIINALVKIPGLKVIARTSAFAFKGQNTDIRKIAETLGVANILEGSVRRSGNRIRVTAQLIAAEDGSHLWPERYDRELAEVFAVQDEISAAIAGALHARLSPQPAAKPRYTPRLPAYEALLKAWYYHWKLTPQSMEQAKALFEEAITLDPQYALALASCAGHLYGRAVNSLTPAHEAMPVVRAMAQRALELDPSLPEAHASLGMIAAAYDYNWKEAERRFSLATAGDAVSPSVRLSYGLYCPESGRREEAAEQVERAVHGDPLHSGMRLLLAICLGAVGRYAEAEEHLRYAMDSNPNLAAPYTVLANIYVARGMFAGLLIRAGEQVRGREPVQRLGSGEAYGAPLGLAAFHSCAGELDLAADWIEKAIEERHPLVARFLQTVIGEPLPASPRRPK